MSTNSIRNNVSIVSSVLKQWIYKRLQQPFSSAARGFTSVFSSLGFSSFFAVYFCSPYCTSGWSVAGGPSITSASSWKVIANFMKLISVIVCDLSIANRMIFLLISYVASHLSALHFSLLYEVYTTFRYLSVALDISFLSSIG